MDHTVDIISDPDPWLNTTTANSTSSYRPTMSPVMDKTINIIMIIVLFVTMISLGCTMEVSKIKHHMRKPKGVAIAVVAQYGIMPLTAFCLAKLFKLAEIAAVVILICGCCPGGALSNILALALQGDMNLSIVMTSCSTLLALGMMPLLLYLYCQGFSDLQNAVPYVEIMISLVMILVPCGIGIIINTYRPQYSRIITKFPLCCHLFLFPSCSCLCIYSVCHLVLVAGSSVESPCEFSLRCSPCSLSPLVFSLAFR